MTAIHFVSSGKGNVGKSTFSTVLAYLADKANADPNLVDGDHQRQTFSRYLGDRVKTVILSEDPDYETQPDLIWSLIEEEDKDVIVDLGAETDTIINYWLEERNVYVSAQKLGVELYKWWVSDLDADSLQQLSKLSQSIQDIKHILVINLDRERKLEKWQAAIASNKALSAALSKNLQSIKFPRLVGTLAEDLRAHQLSFEQAIDEDFKGLGMLDRGTIAKWLKRCEKEINQVYAFQEIPAMAKANTQT